jgi:hypothetical protein
MKKIKFLMALLTYLPFNGSSRFNNNSDVAFYVRRLVKKRVLLCVLLEKRQKKIFFDIQQISKYKIKVYGKSRGGRE